jgi:hypothetical protein
LKSYNLNIAGYIIRFETTVTGLELTPSERFLRSISTGREPDVLIRIHTGIFDFPADAVQVFHAPYVEEINGILIHNQIKFWSVWEDSSDLFIQTIFPLSSPEKKGVLRFSLRGREWDMWFAGAGKEIDPLEYPLDGLILYYLAVIHGDIMIHASGITISGNGYLFSGISGKGKSTMAKIWENSGAKVIHDDRLILRNTRSGYRMYNTPIYSNDKPVDSPLTRIFIIDHGIENNLLPVTGATAVSTIMSNCIQHNWDQEIITGLLDSVSTMCGKIPVARLSFKPDSSIIDYILENE